MLGSPRVRKPFCGVSMFWIAVSWGHRGGHGEPRFGHAHSEPPPLTPDLKPWNFVVRPTRLLQQVLRVRDPPQNAEDMRAKDVFHDGILALKGRGLESGGFWAAIRVYSLN